MSNPEPIHPHFAAEQEANARLAPGQSRRVGKWTMNWSAGFFLTVGLLVLGFWVVDCAPYMTGSGARHVSTVGHVKDAHYGYKGRCFIDVTFMVDGKKHEFSQRDATRFCEDPVGKKIGVRYDPKDVDGTVTTRTDNESQFVVWIRLAIGLTMTCIGALLFRKSARPKVTRQTDGTLTTTL